MREPVIWLRGKRVGIGALRADLVPAYWEWENDPGAILGYGHQVRGALNQVRFTVYDLDGEPARSACPPCWSTTKSLNSSSCSVPPLGAGAWPPRRPCSPSTTASTSAPHV